ncbi:MAG TPA: O-antigen ligase family protein [Natronosporangium sp.]
MTTVAQVHPLDLDPSLVEQRTYTTRRRRHLLDAGAVLCLTAASGILISSPQVLPGLAGIGRPVTVIGLLVTAGWAVAKLHPRLAVRGPQPLRWAAAIYLGAMLCSYASGFIRGLPPIEANAADRTMILCIVYVGVALMAADGLANRTRLDELLWVLVALGTVMALIGHIQFVLSIDLVAYLQLPGLVDHQEAVGTRGRGAGFFQVASTAAHYIEFSTVMALLLPFAIHIARFGRTSTVRQLAIAAAMVIAAAVPVTLSRTGFVGLAVGLLVMGLFWDMRTRFNVAVFAAGLTAALIVVRPGLLGTLRALFASAGDDPSVQGRTEDYGPAFAYVAEHPWFGRGVGTFIPTLYRFIDNDWLVHLITVGYVGTAAYAGWHITAIALSIAAFRRSERAEDKHLCACLIAAQITAMVVAFFFDALAFTTHTTVLAILTGAAGAMWRFTHPSRQVRSSSPRLGPTGGLLRRLLARR